MEAVKPAPGAGITGGNGRSPVHEAPAPARHLHWQSVVFLLLAVAAIGTAIVSRLRQAAPLPAGLIQVNGRMEGDLVSIASKYPGRIARLLAREGDCVARGQVLVTLEDAETRARLLQAEAAVREAEAQVAGADAGLGLTAGTTDAQVTQARGLVNQADAGIESSRADALRARAAVSTARANARAADAAVAAAEAGVQAARVARSRAESGWRSTAAQLTAAEASTRSAEAATRAARTLAGRSERDARRIAALRKEGAVSEQAEDQASAALAEAQARLESAAQEAEAARAAEVARKAEVEAARDQVQSAEAGIGQAQAQLTAAKDQASASWSAVRQSEALAQVADHAVGQAQARRLQAAGQLSQAHTAPAQVAVSRASREQARAKLAAARASVQELTSTISAMSVVAPTAGTVTTRFREAGEVVAAGTPLLDLVDLDRLYLRVYVPETEIGHVKLGSPARIYVDSLPGEYFPATVTYIASTAEFTPKEVQTPDERVKLVYAVKLTVQANSGHRLTQGMPADAVIQWKADAGWQRPRW